MLGDLFLWFIILCMTVLVGYPLFQLMISSLRAKPRERRKA